VQSVEREHEAELARRLIAEDAEAFDYFVDYFHAKIYHYSWLMCGYREDAEEVAQETLLKVFESADQLHEPGKVDWVFRIFSWTNSCPQSTKRETRFGSRSPTGPHCPYGKALQSEMKGLLEKAIRELPEMYRSVTLLRDMEELSTQ